MFYIHSLGDLDVGGDSDNKMDLKK